MSPEDILAAARGLVDSAAAGTEVRWSRAAAILARQALEVAIKIRLAEHIQYPDDVSFRVQLLCLLGMVDRSAATRTAYAWSALTAATHHHGYELPPTAASLRHWMDVVAEVLPRLR